MTRRPRRLALIAACLALAGGRAVPPPVPADAAPLPGNVHATTLEYGLATKRPWTLTFDLAQDRLWIRTPPPTS
ncbi:hypothetical protein [Luteitalea sp.]|jgi:hypothetical protein|uniref:hypothetical protein n=1 Tax=Luteitalea sp. TaxID=2004800 RepID=UPI0037CCC007